MQNKKSHKPILPTIILGAISLTAYILVFRNEKLVMDTFTMGGWYTAFPLLTALFFSFVHGAFASNLLSSLGLEAKKH
ncbi:MAG: hypothetical protein BM485_01805 [Desulfobulbaceae bacterium DB1]|nr:MAG: hypothetical protein BM485_01805 [Desulfobulbaceae bacterium DB1]